MKISLLKSLVIFLISSVLISCGDDEKTSAPTPIVKDTTEYFTCKINNIVFVDETRFSDYYFGTTRIVSHNENQLVRIDFGNDTTGTFNFTPGNVTTVLSYVDENSKVYKSISGSVIVSEYNKSKKIISGTFSGILKCTTDNTQIVISDGKFNYVELLPF